MAKATIQAGNCGLSTTVEATMDGKICHLVIQSQCKAIQKLAAALDEVNPYEEISYRRGTPKILEMGAKYCTHAACPVPVGIVKAVEVAAGLALPGQAHIEIEK